MKPINSEFVIQNRRIGLNHPTYFIADVAANHDGDLERAKDLIYMCAEAGADAAKFQHFSAKTIVSDFGFRSLGNKQSHQSTWKKSVFDVYNDASLNLDWTGVLTETCKKAGIHFFTSPYSFELVDFVDPHVPAYKVGSGDITWFEIIEHMAKKQKPMFIATGAST
ncbi:MAG: N-acetylneuraminate synthase family protein, partial [Bdellovibrio sp.]